MIAGLGIDMVRVDRMGRAVERWKDRFLRRVFTEGELAYCLGRRRPAQHLAARFAAKEAVLKALGTGLRFGVRWREVEVQRQRGQAPEVHLAGRVREIADRKGVGTVLLSLTHDGEYALAQVILLGKGGVR